MFIPNISLPLNVNCSDHLIMRENVSRYSRTTYYACESYDNPMAFISRSKHLYIKFSSKSGNEDAEGFKIFYVTFKGMFTQGTFLYNYIIYYIFNKFPSFRLVNDECINRL